VYREHTIAVVIPAHNEARLLPVTLTGLPDFVDHIVVVDDASADATAEVARTHPRAHIEVITHSLNRGVGGAIVTGYRRALELEADLTVVVGADAQMDPHEMPFILDPLVEGTADYAKGDRMGHPDVKEIMPWVRLLGNRVLTILTRWTSGYHHIRDSQCGYTAISNRALETMPLDALYPRYGFPNDVLAKLAEQDRVVVDRPVRPIYETETSGIKVRRVVWPILWLLLRSGVRRWSRQRMYRRQLRVDQKTSMTVSADGDRAAFNKSARSTP